MPPNRNPRPDPPPREAYEAGVLNSLSQHLADHDPVEVAATTTRRRGFPYLRCVLCGRMGHLAVMLDDTRRIRCHGCGEEMGIQAFKDVLAAWAGAVEWLEKAPPCTAE
jgi:hypothetical protein